MLRCPGWGLQEGGGGFSKHAGNIAQWGEGGEGSRTQERPAPKGKAQAGRSQGHLKLVPIPLLGTISVGVDWDPLPRPVLNSGHC